MNKLSCLLIISLIITSCVPEVRLDTHYRSNPWTIADLLSLDPPDAAFPSGDIIAVYLREIASTLQIRLDLLDTTASIDQDIYILLDNQPGGGSYVYLKNDTTLIHTDCQWDIQISILSSGQILAVYSDLQPISSLKLRVFRDPFMDTVTLSFDKSALPYILKTFKLQAIIMANGSNEITDTIGPIPSYIPLIPQVRVAIMFWNTFKAETPAQALRSWDGSHAGTLSNRHGLRYLIEASTSSELPIILLDLNSPKILSAMDFMGVLNQVTSLISNELLITLDELSFLGVNGQVVGCCVTSGSGYAHFTTQVKLQSLVTFEGLSLDTRKKIVSHAFDGSDSIYILGGDLSQSKWGEPEASANALRYISYHPWIKVLSLGDYKAMRSYSTSPPLPTLLELFNTAVGTVNMSESSTIHLQDPIQEMLIKSPPNSLTDLAWQYYQDLTSPAVPELSALRANYLGQIGHILTAARWADNPVHTANCSIDIDWDGDDECILSNTNIFVTLEVKGGYLAFVFAITDDRPHQIVAPSYELTVGFSDPSSWDVNLGLLGDPGQILGAFVDKTTLGQYYSASVSSNLITISNSDMSMRNTFMLTSSGILTRLDDTSGTTKSYQIPLILDPWLRFSPGWGDLYNFQKFNSELQWDINSEDLLGNIVISSNNLTFSAFNASRYMLLIPEDPNFDYPPGHYLPFPLAVVDFQTSGTTLIDLNIYP